MNTERTGQQPVGRLPWGQNLVLLTKLRKRDQANGLKVSEAAR